MDTAVKERVLKVLERVTGRRVEDMDLTQNLKSQLNLDSIQIVEFFAALEKELKIELPLKLMTAKTGKVFFELLKEEFNLQKYPKKPD